MITTDEFSGSNYTARLKGGLAKTKANIATIIPELIENATNRRWVDNKNTKHEKNALRGWYRYDVFFEIPVKADNEKTVRWNRYNATMIVRINDEGLFFYDIINIKKETSMQHDSIE